MWGLEPKARTHAVAVRPRSCIRGFSDVRLFRPKTARPMTKRPLLPVQVVRSFLHSLAVRDYEAALALLSSDCEIESGVAVNVRGSENARLFLSNFYSASLENAFEVRREVTAGVVVVNERIDRRRIETGWCEWRAAGIWEVHDGRITLWRDYFDGAALAQGALRPPAGKPDYSTS